MSRKAIIIPTLHTQEDSETVYNMFELFKDDDEQKWYLDELEKETNNLWKIIGEEVVKLDLDFSKVKIFPEGITKESMQTVSIKVGNEVIDIYEFRSRMKEAIMFDDVRQLFDGVLGIQHQLMFYLFFRGAEIIPTEDLESNTRIHKTISEYQSIVKGVSLDDAFRREDLLKMRFLGREFDEIQEFREKIAQQQINKNLRDGEVGIIIWGAGHDTPSLLEDDIVIEDLPGVTEKVKELRLSFPDEFNVGQVEESVGLFTTLVAEEMGFESLDDFGRGNLERKG